MYRVVIASRCTRKKVSTPTTSHTPQDPPLLYRIRFHSSLLRIPKLLTYPSSSPPKFPQNFTSLSQDPPQNFPTRGTQLSSFCCPYKAYLPPPPPRLHLTIITPSAHSQNFPKTPWLSYSLLSVINTYSRLHIRSFPYSGNSRPTSISSLLLSLLYYSYPITQFNYS